jgi:hypothetical protein
MVKHDARHDLFDDSVWERKSSSTWGKCCRNLGRLHFCPCLSAVRIGKITRDRKPGLLRCSSNRHRTISNHIEPIFCISSISSILSSCALCRRPWGEQFDCTACGCSGGPWKVRHRLVPCLQHLAPLRKVSLRCWLLAASKTFHLNWGLCLLWVFWVWGIYQDSEKIV